MTMSCNNGMNGQFGDTTLTKVFVGGLAWETPKEAMRDHFAKYGEILEAVIIFDKVTGRSKGYGFVTFKEPEAAKKACEDPTPMINGRRANCNLAAIGARRPSYRQSSTPPPPQPAGSIGGAKPATPPPPQSHLQWYYPAGAPPTSAYHPNHHQALPYYGFRYLPTYIAADASYNPKVSYGGGVYMNGHYAQIYSGGGQPAAAAAAAMNMNMMGAANALMPVYPVYHYQQHHHHHHQSQAMGLPAHIFPPAMSAPIISKPTPVTLPPTTAVGGIAGAAAGESLKNGKLKS
ncbi:hypothetical protein Ancab_023491 [Ancistrocladus abbreviatus]